MGKNKDTMKRVLKFISPYKANDHYYASDSACHSWFYFVYTDFDWQWSG